MKTLAAAMILMFLAACAPMQHVDVHLRDATSHAALGEGQYDIEQATWGYRNPPDIGIPLYYVSQEHGALKDGQINLDVAPWYTVHVTVQAKGYGENELVFFIAPGDHDPSKAAWKQAKLVSPDGKEIEYQVIGKGKSANTAPN